MRLLHSRHDHARARVADRKRRSDPHANPRTYESQSLSLRHAYAHPRRDRARRQGHAGSERKHSREGTGGGVMNGPLVTPSRRDFLTGALVVSFSLRALPALAQEQQNAGSKPPLPGSLKNAPMLDAWIRIDADDAVTVFTGKCEIGQGIKTALIQVAAEE